jgi:A/G-specific adenine glycosylase
VNSRSEGLAAALFDWWAEARIERDQLPWRSTRDPWAVLVAETMLAQTQVARVAPRYRELLERFPTPNGCATAPVGELLRCWTGLGYNRRAVALHAAARTIVERHAGEVPASLPELLALPGVGPYTARAVLATAFEQPAAVVDTNVGRVLARAVAGSTLRAKEAQALADTLVPKARSRDWNLALMDFGSLVCRSRPPACDHCPLRAAGVCAWRSAKDAGAVELEDPALGSAGVSTKQSRFAGSDREGRGRLVRAACAAPIRLGELAELAGWPDDPGRARRVASALVTEGVLAETPGGELRLP